MTLDKELFFNASLSCMDLGNIEAAMQDINFSDITSLHYDVVDGIFNECFIFGDQMLKVFRQYSDLPITAHLACVNPLPYLKPIIHNGADFVAVHYESDINVKEVFHQIRALGAKPVLAFRCDTEVPHDFLELAEEAEWILKLTVHPGFSGQRFHKESLAHIKKMHQELKLAHLHKVIEVDGNIHTGTIAACAEAGATMFTGGTSGLFDHDHSINENIRRLREAIEETGGRTYGIDNE